ncbi:transient receptor potential cation channel subfamily M member 6 [Periophthalmus magnuspinnatus]|uniref:transient receptor potential cation channel subfamily M member 6 n=1 Tax=Periophthalmus magnuspinnatus TaxID=409849 RepID=UPI00243642D8|nr:transient receptor potential cation channel subfamily M member 6 [Periophthalmus magnuspinnatus]
MSRKLWIEETFFKRECVKFIASSRDLHRCVPVCQVCLSLIRCCCGRLMGEHSSEKFIPPISLNPNSGSDTDEEWCVKRHSWASPTDAYGIVDFEDTATRVCRAKYLRLAVDSKPEAILHLMLKEWQMERPKLLLSVYGGSKNFSLSPKVEQAFSKGLVTAALSTGAWILTNGINTGASKYVGEAVKIYGGHDLRKRNTVGITPWGVIDNNADLIGRDVFRPYQPLGNPLSKRACLNGFHSHFLFVDDGTLGKHGCQQGLRRKLEKHINLLKIHPRLNFGVPVVCVVLEGGPAVISTVLDYVSSVPPVPVFVFEGSGRAADLLAFLYKQTATHSELEADIKDDFLMRIKQVFAVDQSEAFHLYALLLQCMDHRQCITIYDSESEDQVSPDAAILTATMKGTKTSAAEQLRMALAWDRSDIAWKDVLVYGHHWKEGSLEQTMLDALVMDRVSFVKLLIDNGMTMSRFLTVDRLEELYNTHTQGQGFFHRLVEDVKQTSLPLTYRLSIIDMGLVIEYLIGGAYRSSYTRKHFRAAYNHLRSKGGRQGSSALSKQHQGQGPLLLIQTRSSQNLHFFRTAQPYKHKDCDALPGFSQEMPLPPTFGDSPLHFSFNFNDLFVWAVLQQRQQMALFLWQHGEEALARATVACKLYRSMATEARLSSMDDNISERFNAYSLEFGQLAVDVLDCAFRQNEQMAMKLLTSEMEAWSHFTCLQMAVSSGHQPFVSHSCTQTLLTDLWTGSLNMRKNSFLKIILSLLLPPFILILEFKSKAEMCHVPQSHEAMLFEHDSVDSLEINKGADDMGSDDAERAVSSHDRCLSETVSSLSNQCLSWVTRIYKFYTAPVVKFWFHTMSYLTFLMLFSYTVLVKMDDQPSVQEWLVIAFVFSTALEKIREVFMSEPRKLSQKLKIWFSEYWNISDFIAIILFVFGFLMRWYYEPYRTAGRICYCLDIIFWFIRVLDLLAVNQHAGPYLTMITKMTGNMFFIVVMMAIVLLSFGVSRKSILSPDEEPSWSLARDVVFQPYWMIYGEVYAGEIDTCDDGNPCAPASFLTPFLQAVYMFVQYIIMVNILIAFFNNIYFDMASTSNKLWRYYRYRYIMTYQDRPWLPPPLIFLSHLALVLKAVYKKLSGDADKEERGSGLKLYLSFECRKKLHEFEEKCVETYFHEKKGNLRDQTIAIKATAERAEEIVMTVWDVSDKVHSIQDSLSDLDVRLGQLQDLSALAVDTLTLLSASESLHQEEARLGQCQSLTSSRLVVPHSCSLPQTNKTDLLYCKPCKSTPSSLLKDCNVAAGRRISLECHGGARAGRRGHTYREECHYPLTYQSTQESTSNPKVEEDEQKTQENVDFKSSSKVKLLSEHKDISEGLTNPAFSSGSIQASPPSSNSSQWKSPVKHIGWSRLSRNHPYEYCRSLSSSVENLTFSGKPLSQNQESFSHFDEPMMKGKKLQAIKGRGWSKSSDFIDDIDGKEQSDNKKTVKIQESLPHTAMQSELSEACLRRRQTFKGEGRCWSASTSLSQLNIEPVDFLQRQMVNLQDLWSPPHSAWNSWAKSVRRSSVQSATANEVRTSMFQSSENLYPHYSAMERNNLMRLAHDILFTPVSLMGGEEVSIYSLVEEPSGSGGSCTVSSWSSQGLSAILQPLSSEEGSLYGGLRQGRRVLCTWAEQDVLRAGQVYVVKAFHQEVVRTWQRHFHGSTALQLCLREIQQQRAAQKMMNVFNHIKPENIYYSPQFLDVMLVLWHSNGQWLTIERNLPGDFRKFNNNTGQEIMPRCLLEEILLAFSHWTYEYSQREMLVLDIQGVGEELTDPTVIMADNHSSGRDEMLFGADNLGQTAISGFLHKHSCNAYCRRLRLSDLRRHAMGSTAESTSANEEKSIDGLGPNL